MDILYYYDMYYILSVYPVNNYLNRKFTRYEKMRFYFVSLNMNILYFINEQSRNVRAKYIIFTYICYVKSFELYT